MIHVERGGRVSLRIEVHHQDTGAVLGQAGGQVDRRGRLPDPALLVRDGHQPAMRWLRPRLTVVHAPDDNGGFRRSSYRGLRRVRSNLRDNHRSCST